MRPTLTALLARAERAPSGCLLWTGATSRGYGCVTYRENGVRRGARVPRLVLESVLRRGLTPGECALHRCDVPRCIEPTHLFVGSIGDNQRDMARKRRGQQGAPAAPGELNPAAKLTTADVLAVRRLRAAGVTGRQLAYDFGVSPATISEVTTGKRYATVGV